LRSALALLLLAVCGAAPAAAHEGDAPESTGLLPPALRYEPPAPGTYELPPIQTLEPHQLLGSDGGGEPLLGPGKVALVGLVYLSCPDQCPLTHSVFQRVDHTLPGDPELRGRVELVTVSFDPERDTPERMAALRSQLAPVSDWRFLTARDPGAIAPVLADLGQDAQSAESVATGRINHVLKVFLVDDARQVRNVYSAEFLDPRLLLNDVRTVLRESPSADAQ
jgi:cytochrome oxidase Cu insertion factor (SCO1/SenC/PrrC family)